MIIFLTIQQISLHNELYLPDIVDKLYLPVDVLNESDYNMILSVFIFVLADRVTKLPNGAVSHIPTD